MTLEISLLISLLATGLIAHGAFLWHKPKAYEATWRWTTLTFLRPYDPYCPSRMHTGARRVGALVEVLFGAFLLVLVVGDLLIA